MSQLPEYEKLGSFYLGKKFELTGKKLLEEKGLTVGRLDGRYMGDEFDDVADRPTLGDPASYQIRAIG